MSESTYLVEITEEPPAESHEQALRYTLFRLLDEEMAAKVTKIKTGEVKWLECQTGLDLGFNGGEITETNKTIHAPSRFKEIATNLRELRDFVDMEKTTYWDDCYKAMHLTKVVDYLDQAMNTVLAAKEAFHEAKQVD